MKKLIFLLLALVVAAVVLFRFALPKQMLASRSVVIGNNPRSVARVLQQPQHWHQWWPGAVHNNRYFFEEHEFTFIEGLYNNTVVQIRSSKDSITSLITVVPVNEGTVVKWEYTAAEATSPIQRFTNWRATRSMEQKMEEILQRLRAFALSDKNIYGLDIAMQQVTDTVLVALRFQTTGYPNTLDIYQHVGQLQQYIQQQGATATNYPMLHVSKSAGGVHENMVAIPTSKRLPGSNQYLQKSMVPGKILVATVKGGQATVEQALVQMDKYAQDKSLRAPAIPFASLVTNRLQEPDTAKWITKVYYPVY